MIDLTPLEVRQKKGDFRRSFRGYDVELVNDFLDLVADRMEELVKENMALQESADSLAAELAEYREKEQALSEALMTAQKLREDARAHAEKEGELLIREARLAADNARHEAKQMRAREEETLRQVRARRGQLVQSFRRLLERELGELTVIEETLELEAKLSEASGMEKEAAAESRRRPDRKRGRAGGKAEAGGEESVSASEQGEPESASPEPESEAAEADEEDLQEDWLSSLVEERGGGRGT